MTRDDAALTAKWVATWQRASAELERIRREEIENADTQEAVRQLFSGALIGGSIHPISGLVEQQKWFARMPRANRGK